MAIPRFYFPYALSIGLEITLSTTVAYHIRVIHLHVGESIVLFNGHGGEYTAIITRQEKKCFYAKIQLFSSREAELPYSIILAQALPETSKIDYIIKQAVEVGVAIFQPLITQRCVVRFTNERIKKKQKHWEKIIQAASEQSGRNYLMKLVKIFNFSHWISQNKNYKCILLTPRGKESLSQWIQYNPPQTLSLIVGPEGGFTKTEEDYAKIHNILILSMGQRILRTEIASLHAVATVNAIWDNILKI